MQSEHGHLFVIAAPSGAGKTSLVRALLARRPDLHFSISCTTRPRRPTEVHGRDYFFVDHDEFRRMIADSEFLEHAQVFDNYYGTPRRAVEAEMAKGRDVILEIDWQGAQQVRKSLPAARSIFILPPTAEELERRLRGRATDSDAVIARRLKDAQADMSHWDEFDYVVVNDAFEKALDDLEKIIADDGAALRTDRPELAALIPTLVQAP